MNFPAFCQTLLEIKFRRSKWIMIDFYDLFCGNTDITYYRVRKYISTVELKSREVKKVFWYSSLSRYTPTKAKSGQRDKQLFQNIVFEFSRQKSLSLYTICGFVLTLVMSKALLCTQIVVTLLLSLSKIENKGAF